VNQHRLDGVVAGVTGGDDGRAAPRLDVSERSIPYQAAGLFQATTLGGRERCHVDGHNLAAEAVASRNGPDVIGICFGLRPQLMIDVTDDQPS
jgi:hypothetical protein